MEVSQHQRLTLNKMDLEELRTLNSAVVQRIKFLRSEEARKMKRTLFIGSQVSFRDNDGRMAEGKVIKIMRKFAKVDTGGDIWRVPLSSLSKLAASWKRKKSSQSSIRLTGSTRAPAADITCIEATTDGA